jgi:hypothetical protein
VSSVEANDIQNDFFDDVEVSSERELEDASRRFVPAMVSWGRAGGWELVGNGRVTNSYCGQFRKFMGCLNVHGHDVVDVQGHDFRNKVVFKPTFLSCDKPSCPECYRKGWCIREARKMEARLIESSKTWGLTEHIVVSPAPKDYGLPYKSLLAKADKAMFERGVVGGASMFHPFRYDPIRGWYFSPHFHVLGHIVGGYGCRGCSKVCSAHGCDGFEGRTRRLREQDGFVVRVMDKRISVFWTAAYQLDHSAIRVGAKRANVVRWFGVCSYRKLKVTPLMRHKLVCPLCGEELGRIICCYDRNEAMKCRMVDFGLYRLRVDDFLGADGRPRWFEAVGGSYD